MLVDSRLEGANGRENPPTAAAARLMAVLCVLLRTSAISVHKGTQTERRLRRQLYYT